MGNYVVFTCDKCGKETKFHDALLPVWVLAPEKGEWFNVNLRDHAPTMELCEECRAEFKAYFAAWTVKEDGSHAGSPKCAGKCADFQPVMQAENREGGQP